MTRDEMRFRAACAAMPYEQADADGKHNPHEIAAGHAVNQADALLSALGVEDEAGDPVGADILRGVIRLLGNCGSLDVERRVAELVGVVARLDKAIKFVESSEAIDAPREWRTLLRIRRGGETNKGAAADGAVTPDGTRKPPEPAAPPSSVDAVLREFGYHDKYVAALVADRKQSTYRLAAEVARLRASDLATENCALRAQLAADRARCAAIVKARLGRTLDAQAIVAAIGSDK